MQGYELFTAYKWLKNYGILPIEGGWLQQSAKFVSAVELCDSMMSIYQKIKDTYGGIQAEYIRKFKTLGKGNGRKNR